MSQKRRLENPEYYRSLGCNVPNLFIDPKKTDYLAEFMGIVLGDGGLTYGQCEISLNLNDETEYSNYVKRLICNLFNYNASICRDEKQSVLKIIVNGVNFIKLMNRYGLKIGNKIRQQVDIPDWIKRKNKLYTACMRGLFDTDGGSFTHKHWCGGHKYRHFGLTFTSASKPLLNSFSIGLEKNGIKHRKRDVNIFIDNMKYVSRFFKIVQPNNKKHFERLQLHLSRPTRLE